MACLALMLIAPNFSACAQGVISGTISSDDVILPMANMNIAELNLRTVTDENGYFEMVGLAPGEYTLQVSYVGFKKYSETIELGDSEHKVMVIQMVQDVYIDEIVVTGTMKPSYVSKSPVKVDVLTSKHLNTFLPLSSSSLIENVSLINGVREVVECGVCYTNNISINGLNGAYTSVLMDGIPMYGNLAAVYGLNGIPNMIIERIEVIKGPSSTLYGSEAMAGVINIITKDPSSQPLLSIDIMGNALSERSASAAMATKLGKHKGYVGVNAGQAHHFVDRNLDGFGDVLQFDRLSFFTKWNMHRKNGKDFSIAAKYYYEDRRNGVQDFLEKGAHRQLRGNDEIYGEGIVTERVELFGSYTFNSKENVRLDYSFSSHDQDSYYGEERYTADQKIAFGNFLWQKSFSSHEITGGLTLRFNAYDDNTIATSKMVDGIEINDPQNQFIPGIFMQDEWALNSKWKLLSGIRLDHYSSHGFIWAPRLNAMYKPDDWTSFRLNFGTGFRIVNLFTEDHAFVTGQRSVVIASELAPERSYSISFNANRVYTGVGGTGTVDVEGYYTRFSNKIIPDYSQPGQIIYDNLPGYAKTYGISASVNHNFSFPFTINIAANAQRAIENELDENGIWESRWIEFAPQWSGVLSASYQWKSAGVTLAYNADFTGKMALPEVFDIDIDGNPWLSPRPDRSSFFSTHNIRVSKKLHHSFSLYTGVSNLFDYIQPISPLTGYNDPHFEPGFSPHFDTVYAFAPLRGRRIYAGVSWNIGK